MEVPEQSYQNDGHYGCEPIWALPFLVIPQKPHAAHKNYFIWRQFQMMIWAENIIGNR